MTDRVDRHIQALRDLLVAEHEETIAEELRAADAAAARGDEWFRRFHLDIADDLRATPYPWEKRAAS